MPLLVNKLIFTVLPEHFPTLLRPLGNILSKQLLAAVVDSDLTRHMDFWETELNKTAWFAGSDFTAADIQMSFPLEAAAARAKLREGRPRAAAFLDAIHARPAYQRALARGGPYQL